MDSGLRGIWQENLDLGIFQDTEVTTEIYTGESSGFRVVAPETPSAHSGGVAVFYRVAEHFSVDSIHIYGANIANFKLESGGQKWYIVGCYLAPDNASTIDDIIVAISQRLRGAALLVSGDINTNLTAPEGRTQDEDIAEAIAEAGLEDMSGNFLSQKKSWLKYGRAWCMHRRGRELRSQTNYILVTDCRLLQNVAVRDARHNTYHYLVLGFLRGSVPAAHLQYLRKRNCFPIKLPTTPDGVDRLFYELRGGMTNPHRLEHLHQARISP